MVLGGRLPSPYIISRVRAITMTARVGADRDPWLKWCLAGPSSAQFLFPPFYPVLWKKSEAQMHKGTSPG